MPLLNEAAALYLDGQAVEAVYCGPDKVWPAVAPASPEHTIFPDTAFSPALTLFADGTPSIVLAAAYYRVGVGTAGWRVKGGRVYVPAGTVGLPSTVTLALHVTPYGSKPTLAAPVQSKTVPVVVGSWCEARFDAPQVMDEGTNELAWISYSFGDGHYLYASGAGIGPVKAYDDADVYRASMVDGGGAFSCYRIGSGDSYYSNGDAAYGTDCIWDEG